MPCVDGPSRDRSCIAERPLHLGDGNHPADGRHVTVEEVAESRPPRALQIRGQHPAHVVTHLHGGLGDARNLVAVLLKVCQIAKDKHFAQPGGLSHSSTTTQPRRSSGAPSIFPSGEACTPAAQSVTAESILSLLFASPSPATASTQPGPIPVTCVWVSTSTPSSRNVVSALAERSGG